MSQAVLRGVVHGRTIELDDEPGLPDGQPVTVVVEPVSQRLPSGEGIRRSAGAWAEDAEELDEFMKWNRGRRKLHRPEVNE